MTIQLHTYPKDPEPYICESDLSTLLGYASPRELRALVRSHEPELETYAPIRRDDPRQIGAKRGRPAQKSYYTEPQAVLICMFSRTDKAPKARKAIIDAFLRWREKTVLVREHTRRPPTRREKPTWAPHLTIEHCSFYSDDCAMCLLTGPSRHILDLVSAMRT